ncbi:alpha-2A adrenergic receptor-like [Aplysia californica]|uniref:Alpha-2A adrenergic receptor-like n=1 Tax=Aplysia californica TaxID=6500 RepID=A0ABM0K8C0_APLCA|nr:alpha-2A adrenergic receptor-like [Aplysia californica]
MAAKTGVATQLQTAKDLVILLAFGRFISRLHSSSSVGDKTPKAIISVVEDKGVVLSAAKLEMAGVHDLRRKKLDSETTAATAAQREEDKRERREVRVFVTLTYIIVGYLICWVPFHIVFDVTAYDEKLVPEAVYDVTFWMTYVNSTINPFLYNFSSPEFRNAFRRMVHRKARRTGVRVSTLNQHTPSV